MVKFNIFKVTVILRTPIILRTTTKQQIIDELREGRKLKAMKIYKDATGKGLKGCKFYIDELSKKYLNVEKQKLMHQKGEIK